MSLGQRGEGGTIVLKKIFVTLVDGVYLLSNTYKISHGAYWSIILAALPFAVMVIYTSGERRLYRSLSSLKLEHYPGLCYKK